MLGVGAGRLPPEPVQTCSQDHTHSAHCRIQRQWELALTEHLRWSLYVSISSCNLQRARRGLRSLWSSCPLDRKGNRGPRPFPGLSIFPMSVCPSSFSLNAPLCAKDLCPLRGCTRIRTKANRSPGSPGRPATS